MVYLEHKEEHPKRSKRREPGWNYVAIEGYCARKIEFWEKSGKYLYELISTDPWKTKPVPNPSYDPKCRVPKKPRRCQSRICVECVKCPHFAYADADKDVYGAINKHCGEEDAREQRRERKGKRA